jgi:hypothetical protein
VSENSNQGKLNIKFIPNAKIDEKLFQIKTTKSLVLRHSQPSIDSVHQNFKEIFILKDLQRDFEFKLFNFFTVNYTFLSFVVAGAFMNLVTLFQFELDSKLMSYETIMKKVN